MPAGRYLRAGGGDERFRCAPGPMGWRYVSTIEEAGEQVAVDIAVDATWRAMRLRIQSDRHVILLARRGDRLEGVHDGEDIGFEAAGLWFASGAFPLIEARRAGGESPGVWRIDPETFTPVHATARMTEGPREVIATPAGRFDAMRWTAAVGDDSTRFWTAGDLVVSAEGDYALAELEPGASGPSPLA